MTLAGRRVLVTSGRRGAAKLSAALAARGAEPVGLPLIELLPPSDPAPAAAATAAIDVYDWIVFTSASGAEAFPARGRAKIAAIGPGTAAAVGGPVDLVPASSKGEGLAEALLATIPPGARVLLARAEVARDVVPDALRGAGIAVDVVAVYRTVPAAADRMAWLATQLREGRLDAITLTSSSAVDALVAGLPDGSVLLASSCLASIGPVTTATAEAHGLRVGVTAAEHTVEGLVASLESFLGGTEP